VRQGHSFVDVAPVPRIEIQGTVPSGRVVSVAPVKGSSRLIELVARATSGDGPETAATAREDSRAKEMLTRKMVEAAERRNQFDI
jgi:hypothetical protein